MVLVILNPYFTFDKYSKENIPWHKHWIYGQPIENYFCYAITIFTYFKTKFKTEQAAVDTQDMTEDNYDRRTGTRSQLSNVSAHSPEWNR